MNMKLGVETASATNHLMSRSKQSEPAVGMGATLLLWTDRHAGTIVECGDGYFVWRRDKAERMDNNGLSEEQAYYYSPDPSGKQIVFRQVEIGKAKYWREEGNPRGHGILIGDRDEFYDFSM